MLTTNQKQVCFKRRNINPGEPSTCHLIVEINNINYTIATLSFDLKKEQLFYLYRYPKECQSNYKNHFKLSCEHCVTNLNTGVKTSQIREISFHTDVTHIKTISEGKEYKIYQKKERFLPDNELAKLLLIESFCLKERPENILPQQPIFEAQYECHLAAMQEAINFSVMLILVHRELSTKDILFNGSLFFPECSLPLILFESEGYRIGRIEAFKDFNLMVMTMPHIPDIDPKNQPLPTGPTRNINIDQPAEWLLAIAKKNFA